MNIKSELKISVAVCTYRRFELLGDCLELIKKQSLPQDQYEIIVVDNSLQPERSEAFRDSLKGFTNLSYIITKKNGIAYARNVALKNCNAPILLFTDDDVRVPPSWCEDFIKVFKKYSGAGVIGGRVDPIWPSPPPSWIAGSLLNPLAVLDWEVEGVTPVSESKWLVTANAGYRVKALKKGGGFNERLGRKGKLPFWHAELGANLAVKSQGYDMLYAPHIQVGHMIEPQRMQKEWFYRQQLFGGASMVAVQWQKEEEIQFEVLAAELESIYLRLLKTESAADTPEDVIRVTNIFNAEGYRACLQHLGLNPKKNPPTRNRAWPVIYVVTPCLNVDSTIDQTILSVLSQAGDFSIRYHIQDGGSTDGTLEILEQWKHRLEGGGFPILCKNIVFTYTSVPDEGMYDAVAKGFAIMSIPNMAFMTWINADDFLQPCSFKVVTNINEQYPDKILWLGGSVSVFNEKTKTWLKPERLLPTEVIQSGLCDANHWDCVQQEGTFFRKYLWDKAQDEGVFNGFKLAGDWNLWRVFAKHAQFYQLPWSLGTFRMQEGQLSQRMWNEYQAEIEGSISLAERQEALKEISKKKNLYTNKLKMDSRTGGLVVTHEDASEQAAFRREKTLGTVANILSKLPTTTIHPLPEKQKLQAVKPLQKNLHPSISLDPSKIVLGPGWNADGEHTVVWQRWSSKSGILHLKTGKNGRGVVSFSIMSMLEDNHVSLCLNGQALMTISTGRDERKVDPIKLQLRQGTNILEFSSDKKVPMIGKDAMPHNFRVGNLEFMPPKGIGVSVASIVNQRRLRISDLFFSSYYRKQLPDVRFPIQHYFLYGAWEGKNPNPLFDSSFYLDTNREVYRAGMNPLLHYILFGWKAGKDPHPDFSTTGYLKAYPKVAESGMNPLFHYLKFGVLDGRSYNPSLKNS